MLSGAKNVLACVHSVAKTTHTYTVMPTISADGRLLSPVFVVLQEANGVFGPLVQQNLFRADNVYVLASKSGKMQKEHLRAWFEDVFFPNVQNDVALMVDSWSTYKNKDLIESAKPDGTNLLIVTCPPGSTPLCQPLDVYGIRMYKEFVKIIYDRVVAAKLMNELHGRNSLLKLLSLTHNQMSSPRFCDMWTVGWKHPGYLGESDELKFRKPVEYCFKSDAAKRKDPCNTDGCNDVHFITCAWCRKTLCFLHFFGEYHICTFINDPVFV